MLTCPEILSSSVIKRSQFCNAHRIFDNMTVNQSSLPYGLFSLDYGKKSRCSSVLKNMWDLRDVIKPAEINEVSHVL